MLLFLEGLSCEQGIQSFSETPPVRSYTLLTRSYNLSMRWAADGLVHTMT